MKFPCLRLVASVSLTLSLFGCVQEGANEPSFSEAAGAGSSQPVSDASAPPIPQSSQPAVLRSGEFVDGEHPTRGTLKIIQQGDQRFLELDQTFTTSTSGPDLVVILHRLADVIGSTVPPAFPIKAGDYVLLAPLQSYSGAQRYRIPASLNLDDFQSVAIWCRRFNATFGAATLKP